MRKSTMYKKTTVLTENSRNAFVRTPTLCSTFITKSVVREKTHYGGHSKSRTMLVWGFTLVEMMVVLAIALTLIGIVFTRQGIYENTVLLRNTAYEVAFAIREAQTYGAGGYRSSPAAESGRYGIHISLDSPDTILAYNGTVSTNTYDDPSQKVKAMPFDIWFSIESFCGRDLTGGMWLCTTDPSIRSIDIMFIRPDPGPVMYLVYADGSTKKISNADIVLAAVSGSKAHITVSPTGYVAVQ